MGFFDLIGKKVSKALDPIDKRDEPGPDPAQPERVPTGNPTSIICPACGFQDSGQFCSQCGSPLHSTATDAGKPRKKPMKNDDPLNTFHSRVVGVTYPNDDGSDRQAILKRCKVGEQLRLLHSPIAQDENAVKVLLLNGQQLGWLNRDLAAEIAPRLQKGSKVDCEIASLDGGTRDKKTRGCAIKITKYSMR